MRALSIALIVLLMATVAWAAPITTNVNEKNYDAILHLNDPAELAGLHDLFLTITDRTGADVRLMASEAEIMFLESLGYKLTVIGRNDLETKAVGYRSYAEVVAELQTIAQDHPSLTKLFQIGHSAGGKNMFALKISDSVNADEAEPALLYDFSIHGDEAIATELAFAFIYQLLDGYGSQPALTALVDDNEIWIAPVVNPDGLTRRRGNGNGVDMNRNYPFFWDGFGSWAPEPETVAMMDLVKEIRPVFSISYHSGSELVNYCWDGIYTRSPENDLERAMSLVYDAETNYGITNGADWYIADGTSEDWYHGAIGTISVIVEISSVKMPASGAIQGYINRNLPGMVAWAEQSANLVSGLVVDAAGGEPVEALIVADGRLPVTSDPVVGDYYRLLPPGSTTLHVWANGFGWTDVSITVPSGAGAVEDITLTAEKGGVYAAVRTVLNLRHDSGNNPANVSLPTMALGGADDVAFSLGVSGYAAFEFGEATPILDGPGNDLRVVEKGDDEGYAVLVAQEWTGPWQSLGNGSGTQEFDLAGSGLDEAYYVLVRDDGDGANTGPAPGADIDAIEVFPVCAAPVVDFTATPTSGGAPLAVQFTNAIDVTPGCLDAVLWEFGDGDTSSDSNPAHTYTTPGVYTVTLTVSGTGGDDEAIREDYITVTDGGGDDDDTTDDDDSGDDDDDNDDDDGGGCGC